MPGCDGLQMMRLMTIQHESQERSLAWWKVMAASVQALTPAFFRLCLSPSLPALFPPCHLASKPRGLVLWEGVFLLWLDQIQTSSCRELGNLSWGCGGRQEKVEFGFSLDC